MQIKNFIHAINTGVDNLTPDIARFWYNIVMAALVFSVVYITITTRNINFMEIGGCFSAVTTAFGVCVYLKKDTEPKC